jgi:hypothetical protein
LLAAAACCCCCQAPPRPLLTPTRGLSARGDPAASEPSELLPSSLADRARLLALPGGAAARNFLHTPTTLGASSSANISPCLCAQADTYTAQDLRAAAVLVPGLCCNCGQHCAAAAASTVPGHACRCRLCSYLEAPQVIHAALQQHTQKQQWVSVHAEVPVTPHARQALRGRARLLRARPPPKQAHLPACLCQLRRRLGCQVPYVCQVPLYSACELANIVHVGVADGIVLHRPDAIQQLLLNLVQWLLAGRQEHRQQLFSTSLVSGTHTSISDMSMHKSGSTSGLRSSSSCGTRTCISFGCFSAAL